MEDEEIEGKRSRGRPPNKFVDGQILIPLYKKGRGRPRKQPSLLVEHEKKPRGRPRKQIDGTIEENSVKTDSDSEKVDENYNKIKSGPMLSELRILGSGHILSKVFVSEALVCDDPIEAHIYDILLGEALPCYYCGDVEQKNLFSVQTDEQYPLCKDCHNMGRGHGLRRKSRAIKPVPVKLKKNLKKSSSKSSKQKTFIE